MRHYLTKETCILEKKYYYVLLHWIQKWEENFWERDRPEQQMLTDSARLSAGICLFKAINPIAASTLEQLFRQELAQANPMLAWNPDLATRELRETTENTLMEKLEADPELLFRTAPLLREQLEQRIRQFSEVLSEMLCRIYADRQELGNTFFGGKELGRILKIDGEQGDTHQHGRSTCIITAEAGRFLYKPHEMKEDVLLHDMAAELFADTVRLPKALDHGSYGYARFMESFPAETEADARFFFRRLGGVCALFRAFASTDFHCENILAQGSWPVLVDLETFLGLPPQIGQSEDVEAEQDPFLQDLFRSVSRSSVLPKWTEERELSPLLCKDKWSILPVLDGQRVDVRSYLPEFEAGFCEIYDRCVTQRPALLAWLGQFAGCQIRILLRNTNDYAMLLQGMRSVRALSSREHQTKLVQMLQTNLCQITGEKQQAQGAVIAQAEMTALLRGDVPMFHCRADDTGLYEDGNCILPAFLSETPLAHIQKQLDSMNEAEREFEVQIFRQALRCAHIKCSPDATAKNVPAEPETVSFRDEADEVFAHIWANRIVSPSGGVGWMDHRADESSFGYLPVLYGMGEGGIAAFAAEYAACTQDARAVQILQDYRKKFCSIRQNLQNRSGPEKLGGVLGLTAAGGCIRTLLLAGRACGDEIFFRDAVETAELFTRVPAESITQCDVYGGAAGLLYLLCTTSELQAMPHYRQLVDTLCTRLLEMQTLETRQGIRTWDTLDKKRPISGFGHGIAGIGLALAAAWRQCPTEPLYAAVQDAFRLEAQLYNENMGTWPDFRDSSVPAGAMNGYCSGAPGMGRVYLQLHQWGITEFDADMEKAIRKVVATPLMPRDHYCCGNSATVEFLLDAGRMLGRPELEKEALSRLSAMVRRKHTNGQFCFLPENYVNYSPFGVLNGLSGVGHVMLKAGTPAIGSLLF